MLAGTAREPVQYFAILTKFQLRDIVTCMSEHMPTTTPDPIEIASRVAHVQGRPQIDPATHPAEGGQSLQVEFGLVDNRAADTAAVIIRRASTELREHDGQMVPDWSTASPLSIGHYDVATQEWLFYPECVTDEERPYLESVMEERAAIEHDMLLAESQVPRGTDGRAPGCVDLRTPLTVLARIQTHEVLRETGVAERLIRDRQHWAGLPHSIDQATSYYMALTPKLSGPGVGPNRASASDQERNDPSQYGIDFGQTLSVAYNGVVLRRGEAVVRGNEYIHIAERSQDDPNVWIPDLEVITPEEWDVLRHVPAMLEGYARMSPDFSTEQCAVVHNFDH